jgi:Uri superfamily endonuclease
MQWPCHDPGTYALILVAEDHRTVQVGRLGMLLVEPGIYVYVGSALGPGGLAGRLRRHLRSTKRLHWHIDYLRAVARLDAVWYTAGAERQECQWAAIFARMRGAISPMEAFGASDCKCLSHLFHFPVRPDMTAFRRLLRRVARTSIRVCSLSAADLEPLKSAAGLAVRSAATGRTRR